MSYQPVPEGRDPQLWQIAHKRAAFKTHLISYLGLNIFFWLIWYFTKKNDAAASTGMHFPWPVWLMLSWGIGLLFHFISAYISTGNDVHKEYDKLKQNQNK